MTNFDKHVEAYAPGMIPTRSFQKGDIVKLPKGWQRERGYHATWAKDVNLGEVWGHVIDRNIHMTGDIEVTLLDPYTREPLGQGLAFRADELKLAESVSLEEAVHPNADRIAELRVKIGQLYKFSKSEKRFNMVLDQMVNILDRALTVTGVMPNPELQRRGRQLEAEFESTQVDEMAFGGNNPGDMIRPGKHFGDAYLIDNGPNEEFTQIERFIQKFMKKYGTEGVPRSRFMTWAHHNFNLENFSTDDAFLKWVRDYGMIE